MKVKAVILRPDRTNDVVVLRKKDISGKTFRWDDNTYFLHPDRFMVTWARFGLFWKKYYTTYYYAKGHANPLPVPSFDEITPAPVSLAEKLEAGKNGGSAEDWAAIFDNGIPAEELAAIFNPWFYRTIAPNATSLKERLGFILQVVTLGGVIYLIYLLQKMAPGAA